MTATLLAYVVAATLLTVTPGIDTALVLRTAIVDGRRQAALAGAGIALGCVLWGAATAAGLTAILATSEFAYLILKWAGACYLAWLGVRLLVGGAASNAPAPAEGRRPAGGAFSRGLATNMLNPKVGIFYVSFLPQFIPADAEVASWSVLLTVIHASLGLIWFALLIGLTRPITALLRDPIVTTWVDRVTGLLFIGLALRLGLERRA